MGSEQYLVYLLQMFAAGIPFGACWDGGSGMVSSGSYQHWACRFCLHSPPVAPLIRPDPVRDALISFLA